jgi:5-methylcytosine-specific restriction endonuclease McrA
MNYTINTDPSHIKKEKAKAREAKKSRWWQQKRATGICHYCGKKCDPKELTMDHIVPIARGGRTGPGNVVAACLACNREKGADTPVDLYFKSP